MSWSIVSNIALRSKRTIIETFSSEFTHYEVTDYFRMMNVND